MYDVTLARKNSQYIVARQTFRTQRWENN